MGARRRGGPWGFIGYVFFGVVAFIGAAAGCGSDDSGDNGSRDFCETLNPCETLGCRICDWPQGTCSVASEEIYSISLPAGGRGPYSIVMDVVVPSWTGNPCPEPKVVIRSPAGEILSRRVALDENNRVCAVSSLPGEHVVSLECPSYPMKAGYRISVVDARGNRVVP